MKRGVLMMAYGGPDSLDDIEEYLLDIRGGRPLSSDQLEHAKERYAKIGGKSPLLQITSQQATALQECLNQDLPAGADPWQVWVGMRHWQPRIRQAVEEMASQGIDWAAAICMTPQSSRMSSAVYAEKLAEACQALSNPFPYAVVPSWWDEPAYLSALAETVRQGLKPIAPADRQGVQHLFTAHSLPTSIIQQGDPYADQVLATAQGLARELMLDPGQWTLSYQCAPAKNGSWLGPHLEDTLAEISRMNCRDVLVTPVGFVSDHVEILYDLDIEARAAAEQLGMRLYRSPSLNCSPLFIQALAQITIRTWLSSHR